MLWPGKEGQQLFLRSALADGLSTVHCDVRWKHLSALDKKAESWTEKVSVKQIFVSMLVKKENQSGTKFTSCSKLTDFCLKEINSLRENSVYLTIKQKNSSLFEKVYNITV